MLPLKGLFPKGEERTTSLMAEAGREGQARGARYHLGPLPSPARPGCQHAHIEAQGQNQLREARFEADFPFCLLPTSVSQHFWGVHLFHWTSP